MPFRLKKVGPTYQSPVTILLHDMIHKEVEVYVDDILVKSNTKEEHPEILDRFLMRIEKYNLHLNPKKCVTREESKLTPTRSEIFKKCIFLKPKGKSGHFLDHFNI